jgi:hypothetical protein
MSPPPSLDGGRSIARTGSGFLLSFVIFALLARTLKPAAFGAFALATAFAEFGRIRPAAIDVALLLLFARDFVTRQLEDLRRLAGWASPLSQAAP